MLAGAAGVYTAVLAVCYLLGAAGIERHNVEAAGYWFAALGLLALGVGRPRRTDPVSRSVREELPDLNPRPGGIITAAAGVTAILYGPAIPLGLFSDDFVLVERALDGSAFAFGAWEYFRPIPLAVWAALMRFEGIAPPVLHLLNLLQHAANGVLIALLARRLGLRRETGLAAMALALTFPAAVETVAWPSGTFDLWLVTAALAGSLVVLSDRSTAGRAGGLSIATIAALLSKETAVVLPAVWWVVAWAGRRPARPTALALLAPFALAAGFAAWRLQQGIPTEYAEPLSRYLAKEVVSRLFGTLLVPWSAEAVHAQPLLAVAYVLAALALTFAAIARARAQPRIGRILIAMLLWMVASVAPVYAFFSVSPDLQGSRYVYMASTGWAVALALSLEAWGSRSVPVRGLAGLAIAALVIGGSIGVRRHLTDWTRAAAIRDRVLASADDVLASSGCGCVESSFSGLPDSTGGAYVFRNGFSAALGLLRRDCGRAPSIEEARCRFEWQEAGFVRSGSP